MNIAILGTGAYGIALARVLSKANEVKMWTKFDDEADEILKTRENKKVLPGIKVPESILIYTDLKKCIENVDIIYLAIPINALRQVLKDLDGNLEASQILCITSKGAEDLSGLFPSEVIEDVIKFENVAMISGPSFAVELALDKETGFVVASKYKDVALKVKKSIESDFIIVETTDDILGVQILATTKNIYAILLGILEGKNVSESTKASVLKCVINDSRKLLELLGGNRKTAYSFAGLGDLLLTCMSNKSRNFSFGEKFALIGSIDKALKELDTNTVEGLYSLQVIHKLLLNSNIEIKSINLVYDILYNKKDINEILKNLI